MTTPGPSVGALLAELIASRGLTTQQAADLISEGLSRYYVSKIVHGRKTGEKYRAAVTSLLETGTAKREPQRRNRAGQLVPVRAKRGAATPTTKPGRRPTPEIILTRRGYVQVVQINGHDSCPALLRAVETAAKRVAGNQRITGQVRTHSGRWLNVYEHGYNAVLLRARMRSGDPLDVLIDDLANAGYVVDEDDIAEVVLTRY